MRLPGGMAALTLASTLALSSVARADCAVDTDCKGDRICVEGACQAPGTGPGQSRPPKVRRRFVNPALFYGGVVVAALTPIAIFVALAADIQKQSCENEAFVQSFGGAQGRLDDSHCSNYDPTIAAAAIAAVVFGISGTVMIVTGAKREPIDPPQEAKLQVVPWSDRNGGGAVLRFSF